MTTNPTDREAVERLAIMWSRRGYVSPPREPHNYVTTASCDEAIETAATLRALLTRVEALEARADIDQSAYEELLRAMPEDPPLPPDPDDEYIERIRELEAERDALREALTPSGETKAAYIGEVETSCPDGRSHTISWVATKDVMKMIRERVKWKQEVTSE